MLYLQTVEPRTFAILERLQHIPQLREFYLVDGTALSLKYEHPIIYPVEIVDNIRMYSIPDIAAMKVNAILGKWKKKDFY